jgi:2',3'-cyclic-nucleotide 2'-phosphodiesterase (5'-nucleotidase family)
MRVLNFGCLHPYLFYFLSSSGPDVLAEHMRKCTFPWLAANVMDKSTQKPWASTIPSKIFTFPISPSSAATSSSSAGSSGSQVVRVGLFGLTTPETPHLSYPGISTLLPTPIDVCVMLFLMNHHIAIPHRRQHCI